MKDLVSIIIPARDEENYITKFSLPSILKQNYGNLETIVVCNGCKDNTATIVRNYGNKIKDFNIIETDLAGAGLARNIGARSAKGDIFVFLDADVAMSPNTIEKIVSTTKKYRNFIGICKGTPNEKKESAIILTKVKNMLGRPFLISNGLIFCNRNLYYAIGGFDEKISKHEDSKFITKGLMYAYTHQGKYIYLSKTTVRISMRRFEKLGYRKAMLKWLKLGKDYPVVR